MNEFKLKDLIDIKNGTRYAHLKEGEIPVFGSGGIMCYVDDYLYNGEVVLLPRKGTLDNIMYYSGKLWSVDTMYYAIVNEKANPYYLYSYLKLLDLKHLDSGSALPSMTKSAYNDLSIRLPEIDIQNKIAKVLSDLDAKIELNNKINTELEAMAKLIYDYWFVQFDFPDENGKPYKSSGGKMVYNEELKREIPEGWEDGCLGDLGKVSMCKRVMKHETSVDEEIPFFKISTFGGEPDTYISRELFEGYRDKFSYPKRGDILISAAGTIGRIVIYDGSPSYFQDSNIVWVDNDETKVSNSLLYCIYKTKPWVATNGSTIKRLYNNDLRSIKVCIPNSRVMNRFSEPMDSFLAKKLQIEKENKKLTELRDWLLPMLMNGQVTVK